jgi:hypothetical protein
MDRSADKEYKDGGLKDGLVRPQELALRTTDARTTKAYFGAIDEDGHSTDNQGGPAGCMRIIQER